MKHEFNGLPMQAIAGFELLGANFTQSILSGGTEGEVALTPGFDDDGKERILITIRNPVEGDPNKGKWFVVGEILRHGEKFHFAPEVEDTMSPDNRFDAPTTEVEVQPDTALADIPMTDYRAAMIAEGVEEVSDEETYFAAWQHLEDTGLGYQLQGWFGRRLRDLIEEGKVTPRAAAAPVEDADVSEG